MSTVTPKFSFQPKKSLFSKDRIFLTKSFQHFIYKENGLDNLEDATSYTPVTPENFSLIKDEVNKSLIINTTNTTYTGSFVFFEEKNKLYLLLETDRGTYEFATKKDLNRLVFLEDEKDRYTEIDKKVISIISEVLNIEENKILKKSELFFDLNMDGLHQAELALTLDEEFGIMIPELKFESATTVQDLINLYAK